AAVVRANQIGRASIKGMAVIGIVLASLIAVDRSLNARLYELVESRAETFLDLDFEQDTSFSDRASENTQSEAFRQELAAPDFGAGIGATYMKDNETEHQIHNTAESLQFRHGPLGAAMWFLYVGSAALAIMRMFRRDGLLAFRLATVGVVITATQFYGLVGIFVASFAIGASFRRPEPADPITRSAPTDQRTASSG
uniref:hypothetical protein n=1 Tax=Ilumatobacter sp. TaxID=1967498 RepID=UPI0037502CA2